ncbi:hypothetical protein QBC35DRAFT_553404 [Podospora australis]|uniref:Uncharacterized protein n=1 Tax=Podospora australis TaxID=1536484 RepID=A0AAN6WST7_9PEZI|nr:hypothetical protein QBC35DRAFT_553404 [Podospora australis]
MDSSWTKIRSKKTIKNLTTPTTKPSTTTSSSSQPISTPKAKATGTAIGYVRPNGFVFQSLQLQLFLLLAFILKTTNNDAATITKCLVQYLWSLSREEFQELAYLLPGLRSVPTINNIPGDFVIEANPHGIHAFAKGKVSKKELYTVLDMVQVDFLTTKFKWFESVWFPSLLSKLATQCSPAEKHVLPVRWFKKPESARFLITMARGIVAIRQVNGWDGVNNTINDSLRRAYNQGWADIFVPKDIRVSAAFLLSQEQDGSFINLSKTVSNSLAREAAALIEVRPVAVSTNEVSTAKVSVNAASAKKTSSRVAPADESLRESPVPVVSAWARSITSPSASTSS